MHMYTYNASACVVLVKQSGGWLFLLGNPKIIKLYTAKCPLTLLAGYLEGVRKQALVKVTNKAKALDCQT